LSLVVDDVDDVDDKKTLFSKEDEKLKWAIYSNHPTLTMSGDKISE
jgi:hypothetical protein